MVGKSKKMAAALAAVSLYLEQEEALLVEQKRVLQPSVIAGPSQWGQCGRQEMMTMRRLTQLRTFTR